MTLVLKVLAGIAIVVGAVVVNGLIATLEDELPGGFTNPDGDQPLSPITIRLLRAVAVIALIVLLPIMLAAANTALSDTAMADRIFDAGVAGGTVALMLAIILRRRWLFWGGAAFIGIGLACGIALQ